MKNLMRLLAHTDRDELKVVRCINQTISVTDGCMLIRRYAPGVADGVYNIDIDGNLKGTRYSHGMKFPDIEMMRPPGLESMAPQCNLVKEAVGHMAHFCQEVRRKDGAVIITKDRMFMKQNPDFLMAYPFELRTPSEFNPLYLEISFIEMAKYELSFMLREHRAVDGDMQRTPLIIGKDWGSCALVMARDTSRSFG